MKRWAPWLGFLLLALMIESGATANVGNRNGATSTSRQRIAVVAGRRNDPSFVLTPLTPGPAKRDSGTTSFCCWKQRFVMRDGQSIEIDDPLKTYYGKRGTFALRIVVEWVDAGNGYSIGSGTWKIVKGTRAYAHLTGNGRLAVVSPTSGGADVTWQAEGYVS